MFIKVAGSNSKNRTIISKRQAKNKLADKKCKQNVGYKCYTKWRIKNVNKMADIKCKQNGG